MGDVARMQGRAVNVRPGRAALYPDEELHLARRVFFGSESQQEVLVSRQFGADFFHRGHCLRLYDGRKAMALPDRVRVKISSETAGYLALTPVVVSELDIRQLLEMAVSAAGFDAGRVQGLLKRGSLVSGASRFRWAGLDCALDEVEAALRLLPGPEPGRACAPARCTRIVLTGPAARIEVEPCVAMQRRWLRRRSFWDVLMEGLGAPRYAAYLYKERADCYVVDLDEAAQSRLREAAGLLRYAALARLIRAARLERLELIVQR